MSILSSWVPLFSFLSMSLPLHPPIMHGPLTIHTPHTDKERERERCKMEAKAHKSRVKKLWWVGYVLRVHNNLLLHDKMGSPTLLNSLSPQPKKERRKNPFGSLRRGWKGTSTTVNFAKSRNLIWEHGSVDLPQWWGLGVLD